jgi:hypothetical protein
VRRTLGRSLREATRHAKIPFAAKILIPVCLKGVQRALRWLLSNPKLFLNYMSVLQ